MHPTIHPSQDPAILKYLQKKPSVIQVSVEQARFLFETQDNILVSSLIGKPWIGPTPPLEALRDALSKLSTPIYFPHIYESSHLVLKDCGSESWPRSSSPAIWTQNLPILPKRAEKRLGSRARRRLRKFNLSGATVRTVPSEKGLPFVLQIEDSSWKAALKQDLRSRNQVDYYSAMLSSPTSLLRVAFLEASPIAYRLDYFTEDTIFAMKWSYVESAAKLSPGFSMIVSDLPASWSHSPIQRVDLHGSPDTLKDAVADHAIARVDCAWPSGHSIVEELRHERTEHDRTLQLLRDNGKSIRNAYS